MYLLINYYNTLKNILSNVTLIDQYPVQFIVLEFLAVKYILDGNIFSIFGDANFAFFQIKVCVKSVKETISQEDHVSIWIIDWFYISITVVNIRLLLLLILSAFLEIVLLFNYILLLADRKFHDGQFIKVANFAD